MASPGDSGVSHPRQSSSPLPVPHSQRFPSRCTLQHSLVHLPHSNLPSSPPSSTPALTLRSEIGLWFPEIVPDTQILSVLNGSYVALATLPSQLIPSSQGGRPRVVSQRAQLPSVVGLGIVRGVDLAQQRIFVSTGVSERELRRVNVVAMGAADLPDCVLFSQAQAGSQEAPFILSESGASGELKDAWNLLEPVGEGGSGQKRKLNIHSASYSRNFNRQKNNKLRNGPTKAYAMGLNAPPKKRSKRPQ